MQEKGQTIIEVLIALSTAVVIVAASTSVVLKAISNAKYTQTQNSATRYAQEGIEFIRYLRSTNFKEFDDLTSTDPYCLDKDATSLYLGNKNVCGQTSCGNNLENYSRAVYIEQDSAYCAPASVGPLTPTPVNTSAKVTVIVSWTDSQCSNYCPCHESKLISCLSDYAVIGVPTDPTNTPTP